MTGSRQAADSFDRRPEAAGIELRDVSLAYGRHRALSDVSGNFAAGSLTAVVGPNGAGKSSLLGVLAGIRRPTGGQVIFPQAGRRQLAFLPQQAKIDRDYPVTVFEFAAIGLWRALGAMGRLTPEHRQAVDKAIAAVGLQMLASSNIDRLSVGQMQRVLFARLIVQDAEIILLDEPFAAIDERTASDLLALVASWHRQGRIVVAVIHDLALVRAHFPATLLLARTPIAWGGTEAVLTDANLACSRMAALG